MPKTPRPVSAAPSTIYRPPSGSFTPVSTSVSVPVIASDSALTSSSGSSFLVCHSLLFSQSLSLLSLFFREGSPIAICFQKFKLFEDWEESSRPFSSASPVAVPSSRLVFC